MRAALYLRVSTEEQAERHSSATQHQELLHYCQARAIQVVDCYADEGVSGTVPFDRRPEGIRLLRDARIGKFDVVLLYKLDRLGRDTLVTLSTMRELQSLGIQVKSITQGFDPDDPVGRLLITMLSGVAAFERETIVERSVAGTNRLAKEGAWLGGIVPYGYRVEGTSKDARLVISEEPVPGMTMSEADVVRLIFRLAVEEGRSCIAIGEYLNQLGVPTSYVRDGRTQARQKRQVATAGIWRPGRIRCMITSTTYKGLHVYGKRSQKQRELIERPVPAIVEAAIWERAQEILRGNRLFSRRDSTHQFLLRGAIKCSICGLSFIGNYDRKRDKGWYNCNGKRAAKVVYGTNERKCPSVSITTELEELVWSDIETYLRNPGDVLQQLSEQWEAQAGLAAQVQGDVERVVLALVRKEEERHRVISLYRKGLIDEVELDQQRDEIQREETGLREEKKRLEAAVGAANSAQTQLKTAEDLLRELARKLEEPPTWETKRKLVTLLVKHIAVDTVEKDGRREAVVQVRYRFARDNDYTAASSATIPATPCSFAGTAPRAPSGTRRTWMRPGSMIAST